jgi:tetratricopeptide (TPR) repeat protein
MSNTPPPPTLLEARQRLSRSLLWQIQRSYFEQQGIEAWRQGVVPHYITSNPFTANAYANMAASFLADWNIRLNEPAPSTPAQPIYIVELGAGSGRFAYHFLKKFSGFLHPTRLTQPPVRYIMTDFAQPTLNYWLRHPSLQPFLASGLLDVALFDAEQPGPLHLLHSGGILAPGSVHQPLVVIANYFFDSIPQDSFTVSAGHLYENLISLSSPQPEPDLRAPNLLDRLEVSYDLQPAPDDYYDDPAFNTILQTYCQHMPNAAFTFPATALACLRYFQQLSGGKLMLLSADKGYNREEALLNQGPPSLSVHGSFSMMVNYHAINQYVLNQGGTVLQTAHRHASLSVSACLFGQPPQGYLTAQQAYTEAIEKGGPDDFFTLKKGIEKFYDSLSLEQLLAYYRWSGWDANIFLGSFTALLSQIDSASESLRQELRQTAQKIWEMYYPLEADRDLAFHLGMLLQALAYYANALVYYTHSLQLYRPDSSTFYNISMCHYNLGQLDDARANVNKALELDPNFEAAKVLRSSL